MQHRTVPPARVVRTITRPATNNKRSLNMAAHKVVSGDAKR